MRLFPVAVKPAPVSVRTTPTGPEVGDTEVSVGAAGAGMVTVKVIEPLVPLAVETETLYGPAAIVGTANESVVPLREVTFDILALPKLTVLLLEAKPLPVTTTLVLATPEVGESEVIAGTTGGGGTVTVKLTALLVPFAFAIAKPYTPADAAGIT